MAQAIKLMPFILQWEGGYVNDPVDKGGETNKGITINTWKSFGHDTKEKIAEITVGKKVYYNVTKSLYNITDEQWLAIFKAGYWDKCKADQINDQSVANAIVDWAWCSGPATVLKKVQAIVNTTADGISGPKTIEGINNTNGEQLFKLIQQSRKEYLQAIVDRTPSQARFMNGWINRLNALKYAQ